MKISGTKDFYQTTDLNIATVLYYLGYEIDSVDKTNPSKAIFLIKRRGGLDEDIKKFLSKELSIEPMLFFSCSREVKNRLYNSIEY